MDKPIDTYAEATRFLQKQFQICSKSAFYKYNQNQGVNF